MAIVINNNVASLIAQRNLTKNTSGLTKSIERLSSGYRINKASDDAAGLSISESLRGQIRGNKQAISNIQDGMNLLQIAESSLGVINENVQRVRELCVQAANDTNGSIERQAILDEINERLLDIDRIAKSSRFNNMFLLDGSATTIAARLQVGANTGLTANTISISGVLASATLTALDMGLTITGTDWNATKIRSYINKIDSALGRVLSRRSSIGALQNRLESALDNLTTMNQNIQSSESRIRDLDIAQETASMTKFQILQQASASVLTQANGLPKLALSLLNG